jgi:hypothetical protein
MEISIILWHIFRIITSMYYDPCYVFPVTMLWSVLGLRMEETASRCGEQLRIHRIISSHGQATRDGPPSWGLGEGLTTHRKEKPYCYEMLRMTFKLRIETSVGLLCTP